MYQVVNMKYTTNLIETKWNWAANSAFESPMKNSSSPHLHEYYQFGIH